MKLPKNKKLRLALVNITALACLLFGLAAPAVVYAGDPTITDPTVGLCNNGGTVTQINLNIKEQTDGCLAEGGTIIHAGDNTPVDLCITQTGQTAEITQISGNAEKSQCEAKGNGSYVWPAGKALPKFKAPDDPSATGSTTAGGVPSGAACSAALGDTNANKCDIKNDCNQTSLDENNCQIIKYLRIIINVLAGLVGITVVGVLVLGGIQYSASSGDPNAATAAKKRISNAVLALVAFGIMYGFLQWVVPGGVL